MCLYRQCFIQYTSTIHLSKQTPIYKKLFLQHGKQNCTDMKTLFRRKSVFVYVYRVIRELLSSFVLWTLESFKEIPFKTFWTNTLYAFYGVFSLNRDSGEQTTIHRLRGRIRILNKHKHCKDVNKQGLTHTVVYAENVKTRYCQ